MPVWDSRFNKKINSQMEEFNASISFDHKLFAQDLKVSLAHVRHLKNIKVLSEAEFKKIAQALEELKKRKLSKSDLNPSNEDVHSLVEKLLKEKIGDLAGKLHTGRSRNDLVSTDFRLWVSEANEELGGLLLNLLTALLGKAEQHTSTILPGFTHLQAAQPISFAFYLLAYFSMFARDYERLQESEKRIKASPLGSGAFAGINYPHNRVDIAQDLGFPSILSNAMDAVSSRDYLVEYHSNLSIIMMHLSRLCEDFIIYSNKEFDFIEIDELYSTGSSIMPNKKNADSLELIRGKTGRVYGNLLGLLTTLKALPMAYNKDLQEDKEGTFDSTKTVVDCLDIMEGVIATIKVNKDEMLYSTEKGFLQATDVADYLVAQGVPFRKAHNLSGSLVKYLEKENKLYRDLSLREFKKISALFEQDILKKLDLNQIINNKKSAGGTSEKEVKKQLSQAKKKLIKLKKSHTKPA